MPQCSIVARREWLERRNLGHRLQLTETDLKDAKAQVQVVAERAQQDMAAYLFHELRNDANAIVGVFDCLVDGNSKGSWPSAAAPRLQLQQLQLLQDGQAHAHHTAVSKLGCDPVHMLTAAAETAVAARTVAGSAAAATAHVCPIPLPSGCDCQRARLGEAEGAKAYAAE